MLGLKLNDSDSATRDYRDTDERRPRQHTKKTQIEFSPPPLFVQLNSSHHKLVAQNSVKTSR